MSRYVLALDQGTTSSRAIVFDRGGRAVASAQQEFPQIFPQPGHVEHDPEAIWASQLQTARDAMTRAGATAADIAAIGVTNQRETTVLWDKATGVPVANAIVWQSRITAGQCDRLKAAGHEPGVRAKTGLVLDAYFSASKIKHLLDMTDGLRARAAKGEVLFGTIDTFLIWRLTGGAVHVTDESNASRTLLYNIHERCWDDELLALFDVPRAMLPEVRGSSEVYGHTKPELFGAAIPIAGAAGDQQAALFGQGCHKPGMGKNTYGTGCFMLMHTGERAVTSGNGLLTTSCAQMGRSRDARDVEREYALEGSVFVGGAVVQWLRDELRFFKSSAEIESLAASVPDNGGVYLVPAFTGLGAPHWDPYARGAILGLTRGSGREHIARAALESIAFQTADLLDAMQRDAGRKLTELRVDGGATSNNLLMQFQSDILGVPVLRPKVQETTALGAAYLAGLATNVWGSREEIAAHWEIDRTFEPQMKQSAVDDMLGRWREAVHRSLRWAEQGD